MLPNYFILKLGTKILNYDDDVQVYSASNLPDFGGLAAILHHATFHKAFFHIASISHYVHIIHRQSVCVESCVDWVSPLPQDSKFDKRIVYNALSGILWN